MSLLLPPVTMSRILLIHEMDLIFDNCISVSRSLSSCKRLDALLVCSSFQAVSIWHVPSALAGRELLRFVSDWQYSLSLYLCGEVFLLAAQSTAPSNGGGAGPHRPICALGQSFFQVGVDVYASLWSAAPSLGGGSGPNRRLSTVRRQKSVSLPAL